LKSGKGIKRVIDVYEFKETLKEFEGDNDNFLNFSEDRGVAVIDIASE